MIESMPARLDNQIPHHLSECTVNDRQVAIAVENALSYEGAIENKNKESKQRLFVAEAGRAELGTIVGDSPSYLSDRSGIVRGTSNLCHEQHGAR